MKYTDPETGIEHDLFNTEPLQADTRAYLAAACKHSNQRLCRTVVRGGGVQIRNQCLSCGELIGGALKQNGQSDALPEKDGDLEIVWRKRREQAWTEILRRHWHLQNEKSSEWWRAYSAYLASPEWAAKKAKVLRRSAGRCEGCGEAQPTQAHHLTYANVFDEFLFDLVALCESCHTRLHPSPDYELPCCGCRQAGHELGVDWCHQFEIPARAALSSDGRCGPRAKALDPLR